MIQDIYNKSIMSDTEYLEVFKKSVPVCLVNCTNKNYNENTKEWGYPKDPNDPRGSNYWAISKEVAPIWEFGDSRLVELCLGFNDNDSKDQAYLCFTDTKPSEHNYRIANGKERGANKFFTGKDEKGKLVDGMYDRRTSGGFHESVSDDVDISHIQVSAPKFFRDPVDVSKELNAEYRKITGMAAGVDRDIAVSVFLIRAEALHQQIVSEIEYLNRYMFYLKNTIGNNHWENETYLKIKEHLESLTSSEADIANNLDDIKAKFNITSKDIPTGKTGIMKTIKLLSNSYEKNFYEVRGNQNNILNNEAKIQIITQLAEKVLEEGNFDSNNLKNIFGEKYTVAYEFSSDQQHDRIYLINENDKTTFSVSLAEIEEVKIGNKYILRKFVQEKASCVVWAENGKRSLLKLDTPMKEVLKFTESELKKVVIEGKEAKIKQLLAEQKDTNNYETARDNQGYDDNIGR